MSERIIGLTIVACGTSLPELVISIMAAKKNEVDIAVGNALGSNIMNLGLVLGISSLLNGISIDSPSFIGLIYLVVVSIILLILSITDSKISRIEGVILVTFYIAYMTIQIMM